MSILSRITKALPFQLRKREPQPNIFDYGYGWLSPYMSLYGGTYGTDKSKNVRVTWNTYYQAMDNEIVSACIDAYVVETLAAGFDVYSDEQEKDDPDVINYIKDLFQRPDGTDGRDSYTKYISRAIASHQGTGDFFAEVVQDDVISGLPIGQYFIQPHRMTYHYDTDQWGVIGTNIRYENDQLIHVMMPDPWNELYGKSPIDKCAKSITMDILARNFNKEFFESRMDPRAAIKYPKDMNPDLVKNASDVLRENAIKDPRGHIILHGADYQKITQSNRDLEFISLMNMVRDRVIMTYQVPPKLVGIKDGGQLGGKGDSEEDMKLFKKRLQGKVFRPFEDEFKRVFGNSFKSFGWDEEFHFGVIDLEDKLQRAQIENVRLRNGSLLVNEVRTGYGEDPTVYGDEPLQYVTGPTYGQQPQEPVKSIQRDAYMVKSLLADKGYVKTL